VLDCAKLTLSLEGMADALFVHNPIEYAVLQSVWQRVVADPTFLYKIQGVSDAPWPIPTWQGALDASFPVKAYCGPYVALSVDGSQIYPDRHQGVSCYLINIGMIRLSYGVPQVSVAIVSEPYVFGGQEQGFESVKPLDLVNMQRQEYELKEGLKLAQDTCAIQKSDAPILLLFDGSLIFWHLDTCDAQDIFLQRYCALLHQFFNQRIMCAWYISMPRSRELLHLVQLALCDYDPRQSEMYEVVNRFVDTSLAHIFLKPGHRSTIFKNHASVTKRYPDFLHPHFVYIHVGDEIGRIEFPSWIAHDATSVDLLVGLIADQCLKGQGYPVVLAEAHEQAVIKASDRDFFYHMIKKIGLRYNQRPHMSKKSFKKKYVSI
jgi:hypothetical protein